MALKTLMGLRWAQATARRRDGLEAAAAAMNGTGVARTTHLNGVSTDGQGARGSGPRHVAIIMDGNGRWAKARGLPRIAGHRRGAASVRAVVESCPRLGVEYLTVFAFSTENWSRPADEVQGLMTLLQDHLVKEADELHAKGVRVRFIGDPTPLSPDLQRLMRDVTARTASNRRLTFTIALNYGGRAEIAAAARRLAEKAAAGAIDPREIDERALHLELGGADSPEPDLLIRTSGEQRLSNFLLWQSAYTELVFTQKHWPDFGVDALEAAIETFRARERRFGAAPN